MMADDENCGNDHATSATSVAPMKVRGLLDVVVAEANGHAWELDDKDPLASIGLGLGASPEAKRLVLRGLLSERLSDIDKKLAELKPKRGAPKKTVSIDMKRAAAVLGADDLWREVKGEGAPTQQAAIGLASQIDKILCATGDRDKPLFGNMTDWRRILNSVSAGLRELKVDGDRFTKK